MQIVYHFGAHCTDEGGLLKCLMRNRAILAAEGIAVPAPTSYPTLLRDTAAAIEGKRASAETTRMLLDEILDDDTADRVVLSCDTFLAFPRWALGRNQLYPVAAERSSGLANLFPDHRVEFFIAIRNPATYLPALFEKQKGKAYEDFVEGSDPMLLRWSDLLARIRTANPERPLTVWCDEDTPLIWPEVLRELAGHDPLLRLAEADTILASIMSPDGFQRMRGYLDQNPPQTEIQRRRIVSAFLDKFALPERIEVELDLPGWTEPYVEALTSLYDEDVDRIRRMPGVTFIAP